MFPGFQRFLDRKELELPAGKKERYHAGRSGWQRASGGAGVMIGAIRVTFWGGLAMAMTAGIGWILGAVV